MDQEQGYFCSSFKTQPEYYTLITSALLVIAIYGLCFVLGVRNIWCVLYKQKYYRSVFITTQYALGQLICLSRVVSTSLFFVTVEKLRREGFCEYTKF